jgi:hypothetical protein
MTPESVSRPTSVAPSPGAARAALRGAMITFPVVFLLVTVLVLAGGGAPITALGVALFVSFWAGPAFGGLFGAVLYIERMSDEEEATVPQSSRSPR